MHGDEFSCRNKFWVGALWLASEGGWKPEGTNLGKPPEGYVYNEGALVSDEDARGLARGLKKILDDIPNDETKGVGLYARFSGDRKVGLVNLIEFARDGAFEIW